MKTVTVKISVKDENGEIIPIGKYKASGTKKLNVHVPSSIDGIQVISEEDKILYTKHKMIVVQDGFEE